MSSGRLESVLVGDPVDGVGLAVVGDERIASPHDRSDAVSIQRVDLSLGAALLDVDAVLSSVAERVASVVVDFLGRSEDGNWLDVIEFCWGSSGDGQESSDDHEFHVGRRAGLDWREDCG